MRQITPDIEILGILNYSIIVKPTLTVFLRPVCQTFKISTLPLQKTCKDAVLSTKANGNVSQ